MNKALGHLEIALDSLKSVRSYKPTEKRDFLESRLIQDAVCMRLQVAGEELSKIRSNFPALYGDWETQDFPRLIGLRNIISHQYAVLDLNIIWRILTDKLDGVIEHLELILESPELRKFAD